MKQINEIEELELMRNYSSSSPSLNLAPMKHLAEVTLNPLFFSQALKMRQNEVENNYSSGAGCSINNNALVKFHESRNS